MKVYLDKMTVELFLEIYSSVGWDAPCTGQVEKALDNSYAKFVIYDAEKPVGMVRILGDGGMSFYIKDFAVIPEYQGRGVGKLLIESVEQHIRNSIKNSWAVSIELISTKEAVPFYEMNGFEQRPCEWDGPGMFKMIR